MLKTLVKKYLILAAKLLFLKEINKLNVELRFWTSYVLWLDEIKEITDEIVQAYNAKEDL